MMTANTRVSKATLRMPLNAIRVRASPILLSHSPVAIKLFRLSLGRPPCWNCRSHAQHVRSKPRAYRGRRGSTPRREHPRAGLHPRPSPAELWKSLWKNSFTLRGPRGQRHQADWRVLLNKSSISPATIIASNRIQPSATPVDRAGGHPSSRLRAEPASTKNPQKGHT